MKDDRQLQYDVQRELRLDPRFNLTGIEISVHDGIVALSGCLSSYIEKWAAEDNALRVNGVQAITSDIRVKLPTSAKQADEDIARAAVEALKSNLWVPHDIKVKVTNGELTLKGTVEWYYQKVAALNALQSLSDVVKRVLDLIEVEPKVISTSVKAEVALDYKD